MHWEISRCFGFIRIFVSMDNGEIIIYRTADGETRLEVRMESDSVWLTQAQMAELFQRERSGITKHIKNVFAEGAIAAAKYLVNQEPGFYNMDDMLG